MTTANPSRPVALVPVCTSGIGPAMTRDLGQRGHRVLLLPREVREQFAAKRPLGRYSTPEEAVGLVGHLTGRRPHPPPCRHSTSAGAGQPVNRPRAAAEPAPGPDPRRERCRRT